MYLQRRNSHMDFFSLISGSDVRGTAIGPDAGLTESVGYRIGQALGEYLRRKGIECPRVNVGHDPRLSSPALERAMADGLCSVGVSVLTFGLCTTPAMYMSLVGKPGGDAAVMVTASHLPWERNGYKFFLPDGGINTATLREILSIAAEDGTFERENGSIQRQENYLASYSDLLRHVISPDAKDHASLPFAGLHIIVDAGNGSGGFFEKLLSSLGANTEGSQFLDPDGHFPNHIPNPENEEAMQSLQKAVLSNKADLGIIFDTDCDRAAIVDQEGREINRNRLIALISAIILKENQGATIVTDSVTSTGLTAFISAHGGHHLRFKRGYRNVIDKARDLCSSGAFAPLAIETSGHAALKENYFLDDGMYLIARLLREAIALRKENRNLSDLIADLKDPAESVEVRFKIPDADFRTKGQQVIDAVSAYANANESWHVAPENYEGIRVSFDISQPDSAWFLLRLSLHDPVLPLNIESDVPNGIPVVAAALYEAMKDTQGIDLTPLTSLM